MAPQDIRFGQHSLEQEIRHPKLRRRCSKRENRRNQVRRRHHLLINFGKTNIWPPSSPDCNFLYYFLRSEYAQDANATPHSIFAALNAKITAAAAKFDFNNVAKTYRKLGSHLAAAVYGDFFHNSVKNTLTNNVWKFHGKSVHIYMYFLIFAA